MNTIDEMRATLRDLIEAELKAERERNVAAAREACMRTVDVAIKIENEACAKIVHEQYKMWEDEGFKVHECFRDAEKKIRARLNGAEALRTWTTEYPTKPGYYWIRNDLGKVQQERGEKPDSKSAIVRVDADGDVYFTGDEVPAQLGTWGGALISAEWYGPIEPPE